jgi:rsbT antagonist protein RsbS
MTFESDARIPIIRLWDVLLVPLQGDVTDRQVAQLSDSVLGLIQARGAAGLVLDLSGLLVVDSHLCASFASLGGAARLMGVSTVLCGMSPEIAFTLQTMGIELDGLETALSLEEALRILGLEPKRRLLGSRGTTGKNADSGVRTSARALANEMLDRNPLATPETSSGHAGFGSRENER